MVHTKILNEVADKNLTGITLLDLMTGTPLDATHFSGPLFFKMDKDGHVYEWVPKQNRWLYVGWHPNSAIKPLYKGFAQFLSESVGDTVREKAMS